MTLSLGEAAALAKAATRGAGYDWGLAEEAARAVRWLSSQGLDGCAALAEVLGHVDGGAPPLLDMRVDQWSAANGALCPLTAGTALADHAALLSSDRLRLAGVVAPVLLVSFAADAARIMGVPVGLSWDGAEFVTDGDSVSGDTSNSGQADVSITFGAALAVPHLRATRADPPPEVRAALTAFAGRTHAPATEASRLTGAGAAASDND
ncbi:MAG: DUF3726 domain-containing protein [Pseudomonadota bacterium]